MRNNLLFTALVISFSILSSLNTVTAQTQTRTRLQQDTANVKKDPMNKMHDSTRIKRMMRDSNVMKDHHMMKDSIPNKKGWMNTDSTRHKKRQI